MDENTLEWLDILARLLMWAGLTVLLLSIVGAVAVGTSSNDLPIVGELQQQNRGILAVGALAAGITAAGLLAGLGAVIRLIVAGRRAGG